MPTLSEADSKRLLARFGVPVVPYRVVSSPEEAETAAAGFGGPAAVKLCGPGVAHKTERALVHLGLEGAAVRRAAMSAATGKPVLCATELALGGPANPAVAGVRESGRLCYPSAERAVAALAQLWRHARWRSRRGLPGPPTGR